MGTMTAEALPWCASDPSAFIIHPSNLPLRGRDMSRGCSRPVAKEKLMFPEMGYFWKSRPKTIISATLPDSGGQPQSLHIAEPFLVEVAFPIGHLDQAQTMPAKTPPQWFVYMLRCSNGNLYTGITTDAQRRLKVANANPDRPPLSGTRSA